MSGAGRHVSPRPDVAQGGGTALKHLDGARINEWHIVPLIDFWAISDGIFIFYPCVAPKNPPV